MSLSGSAPAAAKAESDGCRKGCGGILLCAALLAVCAGISLYHGASSGTVTETEYHREPVLNPTPVPRDIYHVYSPEEERAYRQKVIDSHFPVEGTEVTRGKTSDEALSDKDHAY